MLMITKVFYKNTTIFHKELSTHPGAGTLLNSQITPMRLNIDISVPVTNALAAAKARTLGKLTLNAPYCARAITFQLRETGGKS